VLLPDHQKLLRELRLLERHVHRSGKDSVDHPRHGTDDHANAVCGVLRDLSVNPASSYLEFCRRFNHGENADKAAEDDPDGTKSWQRLRTQLYLQSGGTFRLW
jgi:hypothetical protein